MRESISTHCHVNHLARTESFWVFSHSNNKKVSHLNINFESTAKLPAVFRAGLKCMKANYSVKNVPWNRLFIICSRRCLRYSVRTAGLVKVTFSNYSTSARWIYISYWTFWLVVSLAAIFLRVVPYFDEPIGRVKIQTTRKNSQRYYTSKRLIRGLLSNDFFFQNSNLPSLLTFMRPVGMRNTNIV